MRKHHNFKSDFNLPIGSFKELESPHRKYNQLCRAQWIRLKLWNKIGILNFSKNNHKYTRKISLRWNKNVWWQFFFWDTCLKNKFLQGFKNRGKNGLFTKEWKLGLGILYYIQINKKTIIEWCSTGKEKRLQKTYSMKSSFSCEGTGLKLTDM